MTDGPGRPRSRLAGQFAALEALAERGDLPLGEIVHEIGRHGHALVILVLTIPFSLPLPVWGLSTPFGLVIALTALHMIFTRHLWIPGPLARRTVPAATVRAIAQAARRVLARTERFIRPRARALAAHPALAALNGALMAIAALFLALPLPIPGSNIAPSWVLLLIGAGTLEEDGVLVALGWAMFAVACALAWVLAWPLLNWDQVRAWLGA
jgi:hypothetical protein